MFVYDGAPQEAMLLAGLCAGVLPGRFRKGACERSHIFFFAEVALVVVDPVQVGDTGAAVLDRLNPDFQRRESLSAHRQRCARVDHRNHDVAGRRLERIVVRAGYRAQGSDGLARTAS